MNSEHEKHIYTKRKRDKMNLTGRCWTYLRQTTNVEHRQPWMNDDDDDDDDSDSDYNVNTS